jgi:hypothetical protein
MTTEDLCKGKTCLVVGSAPSFAMPKAPYDVCIVANGAAALVDGDVLVTTSHLFRDGCTELEMSTRERMANRHFASVWLDIKCGNADVASRAMQDRYGITWDSISFVDETRRVDVVRAACGKALWVSSGVWAACLAAVSLARIVRVVGVSLSMGHHGESDSSPRHHVNEDRECLRRLSAGIVSIDDGLRRQL